MECDGLAYCDDLWQEFSIGMWVCGVWSVMVWLIVMICGRSIALVCGCVVYGV
jgi:hypothetical protein